MQEASLQGFFKTIIYIIGFYYFVKILARIFMPFIMKNMMQKAQQNFNRQYEQRGFNQGTTQDYTTPKKEGNPKSKKQVGEYIDYEEID